MRDLCRNLKAVSPILAVLMLMIIAVAASVLTYAWVVGYLDFTMDKADEAMQIQNVALVDGNLTIYVQNVGEGIIKFDPNGAAVLYINGANQSCYVKPEDGALRKGETATFTVPDQAALEGQTITVKVVSLSGASTEIPVVPRRSTDLLDTP